MYLPILGDMLVFGGASPSENQSENHRVFCAGHIGRIN